MKYLLWIFLIFLLSLRLITFNHPFLEGQKIRIGDTVSGEPIKYSYYQSISLAGLKIYLPIFPEISYGDFLIVEGFVNGRDLKDPVLIEHRKARGFLYKLREELLDNIKRALPEPHSSLLAGVTLGIKSGMRPDFWDALKKTGTLHVVVASGMNVTLVAGFLLSSLTLVLTRKRAIPLAIAGIWFYALLSGFDAPVIRAAIMGSMAFVAQKVGRISFAWRGLILSALVMLIVNPSWVKDIGFILSFLATASILTFEPKLEKTFSFLPKIIKENFAISLAAQVGVAPVIFVSFGQFNLLSPLINTLIAPVIAPMTIITGIGSLIGLLVPEVGKLLLLLAYPLTSYFIEVVNLFG
ncbi:hypothetical protein A2985_03515 [Candidatus Woesebacteria bacterium RIFCSPLOWO2_01_FULL_43_11]|uniref:ComEC/Rec2-related protein domain-containing protein n=1 Tax=Candidatus Woesebacteria bacterium RBG_16_42_24 TaxID=1802485 RepID=A0A1F7XJP0_9BACT|nr:MAG: hypothetical protein A2V97_01090 [Candidatus Woesebacteria bacterium RBG_16_42_24]OGM68109.1 MAG: hypothetical protein A2985_03515 [Candidatus Woesebacteria bacterium RIFCSPLOWO2_01_FULL_43_11]